MSNYNLLFQCRCRLYATARQSATVTLIDRHIHANDQMTLTKSGIYNFLEPVLPNHHDKFQYKG